MQTKLHTTSWRAGQEQEEIKQALEEARKKETSLQQQVREAEQRLQQVLEQHQREIKAKDEELQ